MSRGELRRRKVFPPCRGPFCGAGAWLFASVLSLFFTPTSADAEPIVARLDYERAPGTDSCPDEQTLIDAVSARLGYSPFDGSAGATVRVRITLRDAAYAGTVQLFDDGGELLGQRRISSAAHHCDELASALELAIAISIDPATALAPPEEPAVPEPGPADPDPADPEPDPADPEPDVQVPREPDHVESPPVDPEPPRPIDVRAQIGFHASFWSAPRAAFGLVLGGGLRWRFLSVGLEARYDVPSSDAALGGRVRTFLATGSLVPCLHLRVLCGCAIVGGGVIHGEGIGYVDAGQTTTALWLAGGRVGVEVPIWGPLLIHARADVVAVLARTVYAVDDQEAWATAPVTLQIGAGLSASF